MAAMLLSAAAGCDRGALPPASPPPPAVTVARPVREKVMEWDEYTGRLEAVEFVEVRARVSGMIETAPLPEGALVSQGDVLIELDARPFEALLARAIAEEARAAARVELAQVEFNRLDRIQPDMRSDTEFNAAVATLKEARAAQDAAQADIESAKLQVEWCVIAAPISGRISRKYVTPGNLITGGGEGATLLTTIASVDPIYCYMDADERSVLKYVRLKQNGKRASARDVQIPCYLQLGDETGYPHEGVIDFVDNRLDPSTGTIRARGIFENSAGDLLPGLFARVRIPGQGIYEALLVPDAAVTSSQDKKLLLVVGEGGVVESRPVVLGAQFGELRAIASGVTVEDQVIINGLMHARPGVRVAATEIPLTVDVAALIRVDGAPSRASGGPAGASGGAAGPPPQVESDAP